MEKSENLNNSENIEKETKNKVEKREPRKLQQWEMLVKNHLDSMARADSNFAKVYDGKQQTVFKACDYVLSEAKKRARHDCCMRDDEVFGLAAHFLQEKLEPVYETSATVLVTKKELTPEEIKKIEEQAEKDVKEETERNEKAKVSELDRKKKEIYEAAKQKALEKAKKKAEEEAKMKQEEGQLSLF